MLGLVVQFDNQISPERRTNQLRHAAPCRIDAWNGLRAGQRDRAHLPNATPLRKGKLFLFEKL